MLESRENFANRLCKRGYYDKSHKSSRNYKPVENLTIPESNSTSINTVPIQFQYEDPKLDMDFKQAKSNSRKRNVKPYRERVLVLNQKPILSKSNLDPLSHWLQLLKSLGSSSITKLDLLYLVNLANLSLNRADPQSLKLVAQCLQNHHKISNNPLTTNLKLTIDSSANGSIFPYLDQATNAYFNHANPFNPLFIRTGFFSRPRSEFLKLCIWRVGTQFLITCKLLEDLSHSLNNQIIIRLAPSALPMNLDSLQELLILSLGLNDFSLNKYRAYMFNVTSILIDLLALYLPSPGPLDQERSFALYTLGYHEAIIDDPFKATWYDLLSETSLGIATWPKKVYSSVGDLHMDHPNQRQNNVFCSEPVSAAIDANLITLCKSTCQFTRYKLYYKSHQNYKPKLHQALYWGTRELQMSKVIQLPNQHFVPLASYSEPYKNDFNFNCSGSNATLTQMQLVLHIRFHHMLLSTSEPQHIFHLIDLLKISVGAPSLFSRLNMLLTVTKPLLQLPNDSKVDQYLDNIRTCLKNIDVLELCPQYARVYLVIVEDLIDRTKPKSKLVDQPKYQSFRFRLS